MSAWYQFWRRVIYGVCRLLWGLRVDGRENLPQEGPVLVTCNHISLLDPLVLGSCVPRVAGYVAKKELFRVPGCAWALRSVNAIPIDRSRMSRETMDVLAEFLGRGHALVFFPEGTRSRSGELRRGKVGVGVLLLRSPATIVPAVIEGTTTPFRSMLRRGRVRVVFGPPYTLPRDDSGPSDRRVAARRIAETVMERIRRTQEGANAAEGRPKPRSTAEGLP